MAKMVADGALAAMTRRAHDILANRGVVAAKGGNALVPGQPPRPTAPTAMYRQMADTLRSRAVASLQGLQGRSQGVNDALRTNLFKAPSLATIQQMAQLAAQRSQVDKGGLDKNPRFADEATRNFITQHTPSGQIAHQVMQEGHIEVRGGKRGVMVKYWTPAGFDTRWTPIE